MDWIVYIAVAMAVFIGTLTLGSLFCLIAFLLIVGMVTGVRWCLRCMGYSS